MTDVIRIDPINPEAGAVERAARLLASGGIVAFPTETFYGLGADPSQEEALSRLMDMKGRGENSPILLLLSEISQTALVAEPLPSAFERLSSSFWPGPLTLVVHARAGVSRRITAGTGTVGVRLPSAAAPRAIARALGRPITGTSANRTGRSPSATAAAVLRALGTEPDPARSTRATGLDLVLDGGPSPGGAASTVVDLTGREPRLVREGRIPYARVLAILSGT